MIHNSPTVTSINIKNFWNDIILPIRERYSNDVQTNLDDKLDLFKNTHLKHCCTDYCKYIEYILQTDKNIDYNFPKLQNKLFETSIKYINDKYSIFDINLKCDIKGYFYSTFRLILESYYIVNDSIISNMIDVIFKNFKDDYFNNIVKNKLNESIEIDKNNINVRESIINKSESIIGKYISSYGNRKQDK